MFVILFTKKLEKITQAIGKSKAKKLFGLIKKVM